MQRFSAGFHFQSLYEGHKFDVTELGQALEARVCYAVVHDVPPYAEMFSVFFVVLPIIIFPTRKTDPERWLWSIRSAVGLWSVDSLGVRSDLHRDRRSHGAVADPSDGRRLPRPTCYCVCSREAAPASTTSTSTKGSNERPARRVSSPFQRPAGSFYCRRQPLKIKKNVVEFGK